MYETRLLITPTADGYTAQWTEPGGQPTEPFPLHLPIDQEDADELRWYLETYFQLPGAGDHTRAEKVEQRLKAWGRRLFDAVFGGAEGTHVYRNLLDARDADERCLITLGTEDPAILMQPWEMLRDRRGPLTFQGVTVRRQLVGAKPRRRVGSPALPLPLRVLLIVSRPHDAGFIDPRNSIKPLLDALDALPPGRAEVDFCEPPTLPRL